MENSDSRLAQLRTVGKSALTPMVRSALQLENIDVAEWDYRGIGADPQSCNIVRFFGTADDQGRRVPWSLVLKVIPANGPAGARREALVYQSGFLSSLHGLKAPKHFGLEERPNGDAWLWLEDVVDQFGRHWPPDRYAIVARHLGHFNAAYLSDEAGKDYSWLAGGPLRESVKRCSSAVLRIPESKDDAFLAGVFTEDSLRDLVRLVEDSERFLDAIDAAPQTICHWDAHRGNLFARKDRYGLDETVAIDWACVGKGPLGAELAKLLSVGVFFYGLDVASLPELDDAVFEAYLEGLNETGWHGPPGLVRMGYTAAAAMRLIVRTGEAFDVAFDDRKRTWREQSTGGSFRAAVDLFARALPYFLSLANEARDLIGAA